MKSKLTLKINKTNKTDTKKSSKKIRFNPNLQKIQNLQKSQKLQKSKQIQIKKSQTPKIAEIAEIAEISEKSENFNIWQSVNENLTKSKNINIEKNIPQIQQVQNGERLSKIIANRNLCSRREADDYLAAGLVSVNGKIAHLGQKIPFDQINSLDIQIAKEAQNLQNQKITIILHKPVGYVSGTPEDGKIHALTLITAENQEKSPLDPIEFSPHILRGLAPAGRLDSDSSGLIIYTQDGRIAKQIIGEKVQHKVEKEYLVRFVGEISPEKIKLLQHGLFLDGKALKPAWVKLLNEGQLHFILQEGRKRQIRRMCELVGLKVIGLKRVRIGKIMLKNLPLGKWRFLRNGEKI